MPHTSRGDDPGPHAVYASQRERVELLVEAEIARLSRRCPELAAEDLADIRAMLWCIARRLFFQPLARARVAPLLAARLFALDDIPADGAEAGAIQERRAG